MCIATSVFLCLLTLPFTLAQKYGNLQNSSIIWTNCTMKLAFPASCGILAVPLDYTDPISNKTLDLSLLKVEATVKPSKGSILINPGGPGNGAIEFLQAFGPALLVMTGGHYDVIGFDPRGTGTTLNINCYPDPFERLRASAYLPSLTNASDTALGTAWAGLKTYADRCYENAREVGELMGTAFVARDMIRIVDALGEDGMLRFWGQSYGTMLGATVAAMFPERIDKMVIDGVVNPHEYTEGWEYDPVPFGDVALEKFLEACVVAGQPACALARPNATVESLITQIHDLVQEVKFNPIVMGSNITIDMVGISQIMGAFNNALRVQIAYAIPLAGYLNAIMERNSTAYHIYRPLLDFNDANTIPANVDAVVAIRCSDSTFRASSLSDVKPQVDRLLYSSDLFGDSYTASYLGCAQWKMRAKKRYEGDFKAKTKNPMLIIGSPWDMRTPLVNARNISSGFEGSVVLQHNGYGHCVLFSPGQCAIKAVQGYFTNGTLPAPGTVCEQDFGVFSGKGIADSFGLGAQ